LMQGHVSDPSGDGPSSLRPHTCATRANRIMFAQC